MGTERETEVKRETGESPVRSRHCKQGVYGPGKGSLTPLGRPGKVGHRRGSASQETCRLLVREEHSKSRGIDCTDMAVSCYDPFTILCKRIVFFPCLFLA